MWHKPKAAKNKPIVGINNVISNSNRTTTTRTHQTQANNQQKQSEDSQSKSYPDDQASTSSMNALLWTHKPVYKDTLHYWVSISLNNIMLIMVCIRDICSCFCCSIVKQVKHCYTLALLWDNVGISTCIIMLHHFYEVMKYHSAEALGPFVCALCRMRQHYFQHTNMSYFFLHYLVLYILYRS